MNRQQGAPKPPPPQSKHSPRPAPQPKRTPPQSTPSAHWVPSAGRIATPPQSIDADLGDPSASSAPSAGARLPLNQSVRANGPISPTLCLSPSITEKASPNEAWTPQSPPPRALQCQVFRQNPFGPLRESLPPNQRAQGFRLPRNQNGDSPWAPSSPSNYTPSSSKSSSRHPSGRRWFSTT